MRIGDELVVADQGDGWWHCPSPLNCVVLDGPVERLEDRDSTTYVLVSTHRAIEWNGDGRFAQRWGPDHPLCHPIEPTHRLLVMSESPGMKLGPGETGSVPAYPVINGAETVATAIGESGLGAKVTVRMHDL